MIRTPLGQWINPEILPFATVEYNPYFKDYWVAFYYSNGQRQLLSNGYETEEQAQSELDKMFLVNRSK